jgi:hypothetical protein
MDAIMLSTIVEVQVILCYNYVYSFSNNFYFR